MLSKQNIKARATFASSQDEIIVSGISGRFPSSDNMDDFAHNLYNKVEMFNEGERSYSHFFTDLPKLSGKVKGLEKFDASFFGLHNKLANVMDPQGRVLLEHAYEAILDAGIDPKTLRGTKTGVFVGCCYSESESVWIYEKPVKNGFGLSGNSRSLLANRISFSLGLQGPSMALDTGCSSSMYALDCAFSAFQNGECDMAIVGGANLLLNPATTSQFKSLGVLAEDGIGRVFDQDACGFTRAEAISVLVLQRRKNAKRVYAQVVYTKTNCDGFKNEGIHFPSGDMQIKLLKEFYEDLQMDPHLVNFIEAHSTGTIAGDPQECNAIDKVFCEGRNGEFLIGSVKSNMGHAEAAAGLCSIAKVLIAFENQKIPPNINYNNCRQEIKSIVEGRLKVVDEVRQLDGPLICVNSFGFGGANAHALFKADSKEKVNYGIPDDNMPRLVVWSGRTEESIHAVMDSVTKRPLDAEYVALLQHSQIDSIPANVYRGYGVFTQNGNGENASCVLRDAQHFDGVKRPVVWVYSGMGSQWSGMGTELMNIPIFADSIEKSHKILLKKGLNLKEIITSTDPTMFDNILHSFVGIAAIQIGLTDILRALGLEPDHIIGHSVGELGCAYADRCFTAEEMILSSYSRGIVSIESKLIFGSMAAVGVGYSQLKSMMPEGVEIACHNNSESSTISGPADLVKNFVNVLKSKNIFAKEVACSNIAYHSSYIAELGPKLLSRLNEVIKEPKKRSSKWISSSYPGSNCELESQYSSAQYHTNNLVGPVLFEEASLLLPKDALLIEIAPHGLLQAILKRSFKESINVSLTQRFHKANDQFLLGAIGKIFTHGFDVNLPVIHPAVEFPVSRGTPMISPHIKWNHSENWFVADFDKLSCEKSASQRIEITLADHHEFEFCRGHLIDGRCLFPATGYLFLAWRAFAHSKRERFLNFPVEFEDVKFLRATTLTSDSTVTFNVVIHPGTGRFEISEESSSVVTGLIKHADKVDLLDIEKTDSMTSVMLNNRDFYKELRLRGYHYSGLFRSVVEGRGDGMYGKVKWDSNWIAFLDCLLQTQIVGEDMRALMLPTSIGRIVIDPVKHLEIVGELGEENEKTFDVLRSPELKTIRSGGVEIVNLQASVVGRRRPPGIPVLENYKFVPYYQGSSLDLTKSDCARVIVQLALENVMVSTVKVVEIDGEKRKNMLAELQYALDDLPLVTPDLTFLTSRSFEEDNEITFENVKLLTHMGCYLIILSDSINNTKFLEDCSSSFADKGFLICRENLDVELKNMKFPAGFELISSVTSHDEKLVVLQYRRNPIRQTSSWFEISERDTQFSWIEEVKRKAMKNGDVVLVSENEPCSGLIGLVNCLRKEPDGANIRCVFIDDLSAPKFSLDDHFYENQLKLGLAINVYKNGTWGSYRHLKMTPQSNVLLPMTDHCYVNALVKSDLSSLKWISGPFNFSKPKGEVVKVQFSALNFKDVMLATGKISADLSSGMGFDQDCVLGLEYSGVTTNGRRVMGMKESAALATHVEADELLTFDCPEHWTLAEAATVPIVYTTVYVAYFLHARIERGKSILIHAGSGGVGLAAIRIAFAYNLEVFTTVSSEEKKQFILEEFPQLKEENIGNSRDVSFRKMVIMRTKGKGVDYVLNSLSDEKLHASIRCLGAGGKFLEIGKFDMANDTKIGLAAFLNQLSFHAVMVDKVFRASREEQMHLAEMLNKDIKSGLIQPLKTNIFEASQVEQAFRFLASGKHVGKVLLKIRENESDVATLPISVIPRLYCNPSCSYIIPGGLGGFGLELADWLMIRGCRKLVLSSSRGITKQYQAYRIKIWESHGVQVAVNTSDISTKAGCEQLIRDSIKLGPVGGIFNLAVILKDSIFENQDAGKFAECMAPKAVATKHLDELSRRLCPELQYFVVFSSVSCGRGNAGQSNYGMANSVMERIIEQRHQLGLPAKAIQWGAVGEVGLVADMQEEKIDMVIGGTLQQRISSCLEELDPLMAGNDPIVSSMVVAEKSFTASGKKNIIETVMNIMCIRDLKSVSLESSLAELGIDSLMTVELKQTLEREYEIFLTTQELRALTFSKIAELAKARETQDAQSMLKSAEESNPKYKNLFVGNLGEEKLSDETILSFDDKTYKSSECGALMIPGIEGIAGEVWFKIANGVKFATSVLQLKKTSFAKTLEESVEIIEDEVLAYFEKYKSFHLIAHSFGAIFALRIAEKLESQGKSGTITFIDGAPIYLKMLKAVHHEHSTDEEIQNDIIDYIVNDFLEGIVDLKSVLSSLTWDEKVNYVLSFVTDRHKFGKEYLRHLFNALFNRIKIALSIKAQLSSLHQTQATLIRPTVAWVQDINEDYELQVNFREKVKLLNLEGNHLTVLENPLLLDILNNIHFEIGK